MKKILVINIGSTSTKVAYYEDLNCKYLLNKAHKDKELLGFEDLFEQEGFRSSAVEEFLDANGIQLEDLDAIVSRGGHTKPLAGGVYEINIDMLNQQKSKLYGSHPCDIGSWIAYNLAHKGKAVPFIVDPPVTDEFEPLAKLSGHPLFPRKSSFHALSHKATAKRYARENKLKYEDLNLIVVHLGGGISIAPHKNGLMIDGDNALTGDGVYSTNRSGALPVGQVIEACFSGKYDYSQIKKMIQGEGGLVAYTGTSDVQKLLELSKEKPELLMYLDGMIYQVCKQIGAMATVLKGKIDAILITGGIAHSEYVISKIKESCDFLAKIVVYPGENEMESLARGAYSALTGEEEIKTFE